MNSRAPFGFLLAAFCMVMAGLGMVPAVHAQRSHPDPSNVAALDVFLSKARVDRAGEIAIDDMRFRPGALRRMRDRFAADNGGPAPEAASQAPVVFWPSGVVYYSFASNVTALHQKAFLDAAAEWTAWANLNFTAASAGTTNYVLVNDGGASLSGGNSYVGMKGGQQALNIGATSWNRARSVTRLATRSGSSTNTSAPTATPT